MRITYPQNGGNAVYSVKKDTPIDLMTQKGIRAILVMEKGKIADILSERNFVRKVSKTRNLSLDIPVSELMT